MAGSWTHGLVLAIGVLAGAQAQAAASRVCHPPAVAMGALDGKTPREVRSVLEPILGAPLMETNQLPDGGAFAKLEVADQQDGVSQRFSWGGHQGTVDVVYQRGRVQLVSARLEEFETVAKGRVLLPCRPWERDGLARLVGLTLPKRAVSSKRTGRLDSYRYDLRGSGATPQVGSAMAKASWTVRLRCFGAGPKHGCIDVNTYFPQPVAAGISSFASLAPSVPKTTFAEPSRRVLKAQAGSR